MMMMMMMMMMGSKHRQQVARHPPRSNEYKNIPGTVQYIIVQYNALARRQYPGININININQFMLLIMISISIASCITFVCKKL